MASSNFHVKVRKMSGPDIVFGLRIINGEQMDFPESAGFVLMLLCEPIAGGLVKHAPLGSEIDLEDTLDADWVDENMDKYIVSTRLDKIQNLPIVEDLATMSPKQFRDFFKSARAPSALLHVVVTDPKWIAHLAPGMAWDSAAYDPGF